MPSSHIPVPAKVKQRGILFQIGKSFCEGGTRNCGFLTVLNLPDCKDLILIYFFRMAQSEELRILMLPANYLPSCVTLGAWVKLSQATATHDL